MRPYWRRYNVLPREGPTQLAQGWASLGVPQGGAGERAVGELRKKQQRSLSLPLCLHPSVPLPVSVSEAASLPPPPPAPTWTVRR